MKLLSFDNIVEGPSQVTAVVLFSELSGSNFDDKIITLDSPCNVAVLYWFKFVVQKGCF